MDEKDIREQFSPLLDGELSAEEREQLEGELSQSAELLRDLDTFKRVDELYRQLERQPAPAGFAQSVRRALRPRVLRFGSSRLQRRRLWPFVAAAAMLAVTSGLLMLHYRELARPISSSSSSSRVLLSRASKQDLTQPMSRAISSEEAGEQETPHPKQHELAHVERQKPSMLSGDAVRLGTEVSEKPSDERALGEQAQAAAQNALKDTADTSPPAASREVMGETLNLRPRIVADGKDLGADEPAATDAADKGGVQRDQPASFGAKLEAGRPAEAKTQAEPATATKQADDTSQPLAAAEAAPVAPTEGLEAVGKGLQLFMEETPAPSAGKADAAFSPEQRASASEQTAAKAIEATPSNALGDANDVPEGGGFGGSYGGGGAGGFAGVGGQNAPRDAFGASMMGDMGGGSFPPEGGAKETARVEAALGGKGDAQTMQPLSPQATDAEPVMMHIGQRVYDLVDGEWRERGYAGQTAVLLKRDSEALDELAASHEEVARLAELGTPVLFQIEGRWYRIEPRKEEP
jgi:hypothetical protein